MAGSEISPTEVGKNPKIIKAAQEELDAMDVFVCGRCHAVFHFVEEFKSHKDKTCQKDQSNIRDCNESNPKIWAFLLWKEAQAQNKNLNTANRNSWALYQTWVKMDDSQRGTWIVAGKTIQSFSKVGKGGLTETPVKITKTVVNNSRDSVAGRKPLAQAKPQGTNLKAPARPVGNRTTAKGTENESLSSKGSPVQKAGSKMSNDTTSVTSTDKTLSRRAKRTIPNSTEIVDENVEKIVAKRFNPRCKMHEYLVKWENADLDQNTWEPATHLENVPHLLETFEKQLARQKELRAAMQAKQQQAQAKAAGEIKKEEGTISNSNPSVGSPDSTRPARNSKTKAMDQVKQWVSSGTNASSANGERNADRDWSGSAGSSTGPVKRKLDDSAEMNSSTNAVEYSSTMEDLEEDLIPSHTVKRLKNGSAVSVEVKTKSEKNVESKVIKVNGNGGRTSVTGETLPVGADSADVIITQDANASGVIKKPGFENLKKNPTKPEGHIRVLTKSESAVSNSGIVRLNDDSKTPVRTTPLRVGNNLSSGTTIRQVPQRTPGGTTIQRKTASGSNNGKTTMQPTVRTTAQPAPQSGRMFVSRQNAATNRSLNTTPTNPAANKPVTPEQKILQLSKSGDLKVTKKVMTREDAVARMNPAQRQQQQRQQQQQQQQSQVQIQKVQQLQQNAARAGTQISRTKPAEQSHEAQLCPITGKLLGQEDTATTPAVQNHANDQQQQLAFKQDSEQQQQQQLQNMDSALILGNDQQMLTNEDGTPLLVTGEDGTVYQVAGKNAQGQTILVTQGPDGEQQFAYVAAAEADENQMTLDNVVAEAVAQLPAEQQAEALAAAVGEGQYLVKTTQEDGTTQVVTMSEAELAQHQALAAQQQQQQIAGTNSNNVDATGQLCVQTEAGDGQEANIPAEVVQADLPSPGGTRRVVLLLQDGTYMMTEMHDDEFKALNIAA